MRFIFPCALALVSAPLASQTHAAMVTATLTADNHYSIYTGAEDGSVMNYVGGNETGAGGSPGTYNWSLPEPYVFTSSDEYLYVAAWSDDYVAQGLLGVFTIDATTLVSGSSAWQVYATGQDRDDGAAHPAVAEVGTQVALAELAAAWTQIAVGGLNGVQPWGTVTGITPTAAWMWSPAEQGGDPFAPGADHGEYLLFRTPIPEPATTVLLFCGLIATIRQHRRDLREAGR